MVAKKTGFDKKSGPVKPPIIDLEANKGKTSSKSKKREQKPAAQIIKKDKSRSKTDEKVDLGAKGKAKIPFSERLLASVYGAFGGAALGVAASFLLALLGFWPQNNTVPASEVPAQNLAMISQLQQQLSEFESLSKSNQANISSISAILKKDENDFALKLQDINSQLSQQIEKLQHQIEAQKDQITTQFDEQFASIDLGVIENKIAQFDERLNALAAGASNEEAIEFANSIADLKTNIGDLSKSITYINDNIALHNSQIAAIEENITQITEQSASQQASLKQAEEKKAKQSVGAQTQLALSSFESAIYSGKSFDLPLSKLSEFLPEFEFSDELKQSAVRGFDDPKNIISEFSALVPEILRARPAAQGASWQERLSDKALSLLALRPTGEVEGDSPIQLVARIETALQKQDFIVANELIKSLPQPMQEALGKVGKKIADFANAQELIKEIKDEALNNVDSISSN